jgi:hypothetical protein
LLADGEMVYFLGDVNSPMIDVGPRLEDLLEFLSDMSSKLTDIKFIGHSEGAATVGELMANFVNGKLDKTVAGNLLENQLTAVFLVDCPTGFPGPSNYDWQHLNDLPRSLTAKTQREIKTADIYNHLDNKIHPNDLNGWTPHDLGLQYNRPLDYVLKGALTCNPLGAITDPVGQLFNWHDKIKAQSVAEIAKIMKPK